MQQKPCQGEAEDTCTAWAPIEDSDQPAHARSLIRGLNVRSMGYRTFNGSSCLKLRLWSYADAQTYFNLRCTVLHCQLVNYTGYKFNCKKLDIAV